MQSNCVSTARGSGQSGDAPVAAEPCAQRRANEKAKESWDTISGPEHWSRTTVFVEFGMLVATKCQTSAARSLLCFSK